jgi:integral membrane sensor domain MASE1
MREPHIAQSKEPLEETNYDDNSPVRLLVLGLIAGSAYYLGALIGFVLTFPDDAVSALWPPNAILLSFLCSRLQGDGGLSCSACSLLISPCNFKPTCQYLMASAGLSVILPRR